MERGRVQGGMRGRMMEGGGWWEGGDGGRGEMEGIIVVLTHFQS